MAKIDDVFGPMKRALDDVPVHLGGLSIALRRLTAKQIQTRDGVDGVDKFDHKADVRGKPDVFEVTPVEAPPKKGASTTEKGEYGEKVAQKFFTDAPPDGLGYKPLHGDKNVNANGIDAIYQTPPPDVKYVIVEVKYSTSGNPSLGKTDDGRQMSNDWITGKETNTDRIFEALKKDNPDLADKVRDAFDRGEVEKLLVTVTPK